MLSRGPLKSSCVRALPLLLGALLCACGESTPLNGLGAPQSQNNGQSIEEPLIPLEKGYMIGSSVFASIETFLKYAEAVGTGQYDSQDYFDDLYATLKEPITEALAQSLENQEISILDKTVPAESPHSTVISTDSAAVPTIRLGVSIKSVNCSQENAANLIQDTSTALSSFLADRFNHLKLVGSKSGLEQLLEKGQVLLISVYGPNECWIDITTTLSKVNP